MAWHLFTLTVQVRAGTDSASWHPGSDFNGVQCKLSVVPLLQTLLN